MNRFLPALALLFLAVASAPAYIGSPITAGPLHIRVGTSDLIALGKIDVVEKEPSLVLNPFAQNKIKGLYVGTVSLAEVIHGDKALKSVKVAAPFYYVTVDYDKIIKPQEHAPALKTFRKGREGLFFLQWSPVHKHYTLAYDPLFVEKDDPVYRAELDRTRYFAKLLADPNASLQAKDERDRTTTAALLVYRYRWPRLCGNTETPIDAKESKLILGAMAEAKWDLYPNDIRVIAMSTCFNILGSLGQPGWVGTKGHVYAERQINPAKAWLAKSKGTFRIHKFVWDAK